ncbi:hypothetical protein MNBD_GAMMA16-1784 [hydrothermal vent metagenome]|uniref:RNA polymerase ECF-type sigma factor n=1 Tax=hydrothermal vent metagenome TaxID=652676 RepID=A0A3B0ZTJ5_9ZZZZ
MPELLTTLLQQGYRYALSLTHHATKAEDLLQDAWIAVIQANGPHEKGYLFSAIRSRFYNLHKRKQLVPMVALESIQESVHEQHDPATSIQYGFEDPRLESALAQLRGIEREVLYLSAVEGYTAQEITAITGQARGTVLSMLSRTKNKIQRHFIANADKAVLND